MKCVPIYLNIVHELKGTEIKTKPHLRRLYGDVYNLCHLSFQIFPPEVLHSQL
jgi:hypothetical protein